jgi:DNA processing protein
MRRDACPACLTRALLLSGLAAHIDKSVDERRGERARDLLSLGDEELARAVAPDRHGQMLRRARDGHSHDATLAALEATGCWSTCPHASGYPEAFEALGASRPRALFGAGARLALATLDPARSVTVVGSRRAGAYGREVAHDLSRLVAASGVEVISGMALGVDSAAHEGALAGGRGTVAILAAGAERPYPRSRRQLYERIRRDGLVLSELPPGSPTFRWMFPARNRLMAALADVTVVVEAAERSGSLITAEMAIEAGRQVGAVPGPVNSWRSSGCNKLLAEGAAVIRDARDVLELLLGPGAAVPAESGRGLDERERQALEAIEDGVATAGAVAAVTGLEFGAVQASLGALERAGYVRAGATGRYTRTTLAAP